MLVIRIESYNLNTDGSIIEFLVEEILAHGGRCLLTERDENGVCELIAHFGTEQKRVDSPVELKFQSTINGWPLPGYANRELVQSSVDSANFTG